MTVEIQVPPLAIYLDEGETFLAVFMIKFSLSSQIISNSHIGDTYSITPRYEPMTDPRVKESL